VGSEPWTEVVITTKDLDDTRREELLGQFTHLQVAVRSERRRLDDDRVTGEHGWGDLASSKMNREIPWHDADADTERCVSDNDLLGLVLLHDLLLQLELGQRSQPVDSSLGLTDGELKLSMVSTLLDRLFRIG
jgi:hypothetical protein